MTLTVAVVNHGNYLGRGDEYVAKMRAMTSRNLTTPHQFVCLTDEGEYGGWWSKIELFRPGRFKGRVLYLDLDSVVVGPLDTLAATKGIVYLPDWGWTVADLCSSVMCWDAGEHDDVFTSFTFETPEFFRGDQDWITRLGGWAHLPKNLCRSYRYHAVKKPPKGCVHVSFHGSPKPHEVATGWVPELWR